MNNKHTAGQWSYTNANNSDYFDIDCNGNRIASILINPENPNQEKEECEANAKLITAAPKLLESLQEALSIIDRLETNKESCITNAEFNRLNAAIKQATT